MTFVITGADVIKDQASYFEALPKTAAQAMSIALNYATGTVGRAAAKKEILQQVNFPAGYLDQPNRLWQSVFSSPSSLEARLSGRDRPTSLARFATSTQPVRRGASFSRAGGTSRGAAVMVRPGQLRTFQSGFLVQLRNGNTGFAIRLASGAVPRAAYRPTAIFKRRDGTPSGVWLLYGPSVNQVFESVASEVSPEIVSALQDEFTRQWLRLAPGRAA